MKTDWSTIMALVLVPGFIVDKDLWADFEQGMEEFGPIIHADLTQDDSIAAMARRIIANAPLHFVIMGFSMGGYVAREVARLAPDRVRALVLVATSSRGDTTEQIERKLFRHHRPPLPTKWEPIKAVLESRI